jgi:transposase
VSWLDDLRTRLEAEQNLTADRVVAIVSAEWGGCRVYIPQRPAAPKILPTDTPTTVRARYGVPRSTAYAWVNRWRR